MFLNSESCVTDLCLKVVVVVAVAIVMWLMKSDVIQDSAICLGC